jgi:glycosyltransferase involved in cell wall biosynthesis
MTSPAATTPLVSVVMPTWNGETLIGETLAHLSAQTMPDFEVLVVDDCSTDATRAVVAAYPDPRVRLIAAPSNGGPVLARNRGVAKARGRFIAGLDHDDLCRPDRLARQVAYLDAHPDVVLVGTQADYLFEGVTSPSTYPAVTTPALIEWLLLIENPLVWSSVLFRAEAAHALDPFTRPELVYAEDFDLYHRIHRFGRLARLDEALTVYRQHPGGVSRRFVDIMRASATRVLADVHADLLGERSEEVARLLAHHMMGGEPVPDRATLFTLGHALGAIQRRYLDRHAVGAEDLRLIRWETAQRWGRVGRAALRAGTVSLPDLVSVRPDHLGLGYAGPESLLWAGVIGGARRARAAATT